MFPLLVHINLDSFINIEHGSLNKKLMSVLPSSLCTPGCSAYLSASAYIRVCVYGVGWLWLSEWDQKPVFHFLARPGESVGAPPARPAAVVSRAQRRRPCRWRQHLARTTQAMPTQGAAGAAQRGPRARAGGHGGCVPAAQGCVDVVRGVWRGIDNTENAS